MLARQDLSTPPSRLHFAALTERLADHYGPNAREVEPGHWACEVLTGEGRSQVVHLLLRERAGDPDPSRVVVSSPVGALPPRADLEGLLRRNATLDVGAVCVEDIRTDDGVQPFVTVRATLLVRTTDADEAWETVERLARTADVLEKELFVRDVF